MLIVSLYMVRSYKIRLAADKYITHVLCVKDEAVCALCLREGCLYLCTYSVRTIWLPVLYVCVRKGCLIT